MPTGTTRKDEYHGTEVTSVSGKGVGRDYSSYLESFTTAALDTREASKQPHDEAEDLSI